MRSASGGNARGSTMGDQNILDYGHTAPVAGPKRFWFAVAGLAIFPLTYLGSIYLAWLFAWIQLGHRPISGGDDPKQFDGVTGFLYLVWALLEYFGFRIYLGILLLIPLLAGLVYPLTLDSLRFRRNWWVFLLIGASWILLFVQRTIDPFRVLYWAYD